jgi:hypothetical protein
MQQVVRALMLFLAVGIAVGCRFVDPQPKGRSPLVPLVVSPDDITLEIFSAPTPLGDPQVDKLWQEVDEQPLPAELRRKLRENGLRAGIVGPHVPDALAQLLKITDEPISAAERSLVSLDPEPAPRLHIVQPRPGQRHEQIVSKIYDEMVLLRCNGREVAGHTYHKAECRFEFRVFPEPDTRVRVELTPELHHGDIQKKFSGGDGVFMMKQVRATQVFDELKLAATLGPGQMLVVTCQSDRPGTIGHYFFAQANEDKPLQQLWVFRVTQAGADRAFYTGPAAKANAISSDQHE